MKLVGAENSNEMSKSSASNRVMSMYFCCRYCERKVLLKKKTVQNSGFLFDNLQERFSNF